MQPWTIFDETDARVDSETIFPRRIDDVVVVFQVIGLVLRVDPEFAVVNASHGNNALPSEKSDP